MIRKGLKHIGGKHWRCVACEAQITADCECCEPPRCECREILDDCECDNTHAQNDTVCRYCYWLAAA